MLLKWMGMMPDASAHGAMIDQMLEVVHWFMLFLFVGWSIFFLYALFRFRKSKHPKADYHGVKSHLSTHLEVGVILIEVVLLLAFAFPLWNTRASLSEFPKENALLVRAIGEQFLWTFHYAGPDRKFGTGKAEYVKAGSNPLGLDPEDPNGKDDFFLQGTLKAPLGQPLIVQLSSKDVIHNMTIPAMRMSHDAIPGTKSEIPIWFTPVKMNEDGFEIVCGQLCGSGHGTMRAVLQVMEPGEYNAWADSMAPKKVAQVQ